MGREIRRVPANWEHPKKSEPNHRLGIMEERYQPMRDTSVESAWAEWQAEFAAWLAGKHDRVIAEYGATNYPKAEPYRAFCAWHGAPPEPAYYRPDWDESTATWYQVYETVSEGTPVTPPFATQAELVDYLVTHGDFWDQKRRAEGYSGGIPCGPWERKNAESFVGAGWAPSMMVTTTEAGTEIKTARDGMGSVDTGTTTG